MQAISSTASAVNTVVSSVDGIAKNFGSAGVHYSETVDVRAVEHNSRVRAETAMARAKRVKETQDMLTELGLDPKQFQ